MKTSDVSIIVPTLGNRDRYLSMALASIRAAGEVHLVVVAPESFRTSPILQEFPPDQFVPDPNKGLVEALNTAILELPQEIKYLNWLGDDDLLAPGSISKSRSILDEQNDASFTYGICRYVNEDGSLIGINRSGKWATRLIHFGPDLIPQPGSLIRKTKLEEIGYLNKKYTHAFDMDMFIKLLRAGNGHYIGEWMASFRWHSESLSVQTRKRSVYEASKIRRDNYPFSIKILSLIWEIPVTLTVFAMGLAVSKKSRQL